MKIRTLEIDEKQMIKLVRAEILFYDLSFSTKTIIKMVKGKGCVLVNASSCNAGELIFELTEKNMYMEIIKLTINEKKWSETYYVLYVAKNESMKIPFLD